eukprot:TRINITY_DN14695_c0_g1_i1.p1 TRINITY_DN14695_c0_g1~~TRINITY_DN14695_c0_g1_i1.p1  ORF type:complete len:618 (+),score=114.02 TRINITY_DN14695_c0_g1_i1:82-1935(+)
MTALSSLQVFLLEKQASAIGSTARVTQRKLRKIAHRQEIAEIFHCTDKALSAIKAAIGASTSAADTQETCTGGEASREPQSTHEEPTEDNSGSGSGGDTSISSHQLDGSQGTHLLHGLGFIEAINCMNGAGNGATRLSSEESELVDKLLLDPLRCIAPVLRAELVAALLGQSVDIDHLAILRRNVAAHPRTLSAHLFISLLSSAQLRAAQRGLRNADDIALRIDALENQLAQLAEGSRHDHATLSMEGAVGTHACGCDFNASMDLRADSFNQHFLQALHCAEAALGPNMSCTPAPGTWHTALSLNSNVSLNVDAPCFVPARAQAEDAEHDDGIIATEAELRLACEKGSMNIHAPEYGPATPVEVVAFTDCEEVQICIKDGFDTFYDISKGDGCQTEPVACDKASFEACVQACAAPVNASEVGTQTCMSVHLHDSTIPMDRLASIDDEICSASASSPDKATLSLNNRWAEFADSDLEEFDNNPAQDGNECSAQINAVMDSKNQRQCSPSKEEAESGGSCNSTTPRSNMHGIDTSARRGELRANGRGKGRAIHNHNDSQELELERIVYQTAEVLHSRNPRQHANFRAARDNLHQLARNCNDCPTTLDIVMQLIHKMEDT